MKKNRIVQKVWLIYCLICVFALWGCGGGSSSSPAAPATNKTTTTVTSGAGGTTVVSTSTTPDSVATVTVPQGTVLYSDIAGTLPVTGTITISTTAVTDRTALSSGALAASLSGGPGEIVDVVAAIAEIKMTSGGSSVKTFSAPISVNLKLPASYAIGSNVDYYSYDGLYTWTKEGTAVVKADRSIDMIVTHLSLWGAMTYKVPFSLVSWTSVITDNSTSSPLQGVAVTTTLLANTLTATTDANGSFTFASIPSNTSFGVKLSKAGYADIYSARITLAGSSNSSSRPYAMVTPAQLTAWGNNAGNGIIRSRVLDANNVPIEGAVVTAIDADNNTSYPVTYSDASVTPALVVNSAGTNSTGRYVVMNVPAGRTVNVTASRMGYIFNTRVFDVKADSLSQSSISGSLGMTESMISGKTFTFFYTYNNSSGTATINADHTISFPGSSMTGTWNIVSPTQMVVTFVTSPTNIETDIFTLTSATSTTFTGTMTWTNSSNANTGTGTMTYTLLN